MLEETQEIQSPTRSPNSKGFGKVIKSMKKLFKKTDIDEVIETVQQCKILPIKDLKRLCEKAQSVLRREVNVVQVQAPVRICGDIHGQFPDLLQIFKLGGDASTNRYLFLGDYVDRGHYSIETITYLLALKVKYPQNLILLRGNHQSRVCSKDYGFYDECRQKYQETEAYNCFMQTFDCLPIAAVVENKFFCMHGGLSPSLSMIQQAASLNRFQEVPVQGAITDLLWADPSLQNGFSPNTGRDISYYFGPDITKKFTHDNQLRCITRAHELSMGGYELEHNQKVMTVFSAPNYCYRCGNKGAFLELGPNLEGRFVVFGQVAEHAEQQPDRKIPRHFT